MRVNFTFEFGDDDRRAISYQYGDATKASNADCVEFARKTIRATLEVLVSEMNDGPRPLDDMERRT